MVGTRRFGAALCVAGAIVGILFGGHAAWGNMAPPPIQTETIETTPLQVYVNPYEAETRIVIPQSMLAQPVASGSDTTSVIPYEAETRTVIPQSVLAQPVAPGSDTTSVIPVLARPQKSSSNGKKRIVAAGVTASLLLIGGGLIAVLVRRRRGLAATAVGVAFLAGLGVVMGTSVGDSPREPTEQVWLGAKYELAPRELPTTALTRSGQFLTLPLDGEVVVESSSQVNSVVIYLGKNFAGKVHELTKPEPSLAELMGPSGYGGEYGDELSTEYGSLGGESDGSEE